MPPKRQRGPRIVEEPATAPQDGREELVGRARPPRQNIGNSEESDTEEPQSIAEDADIDMDDDDDFVNNDNFPEDEDEPMDLGNEDDDEDDEDVEVVGVEQGVVHAPTIDYSNVLLPGRVQIMNFGNNTNRKQTLFTTVKEIRHQILLSFRTAFQARENVKEELVRGAQRMIKQLDKANFLRAKKYDMARYFFNELDARLSMMMEETTVHENRLRCLKMATLVALELYIGNKGDDIVPFILNFIEAWSNSADVSGRINATCFATFMFETGIYKYEKNQQPENTFCGWSPEISARLYLLIQKALLDREPSARIPAIKGIGKLQGHAIPSQWPAEAREHTPRELLMRSCRDGNSDCRVTAITTLIATENDVGLLCDIAKFDKEISVRCAAVASLGKLRPSKHVNLKIKVLDLALKDHDPSVRESARSVIRDWVAMLSDRWSKRKPEERRGGEVEAMADDKKAPEEKSKGYYLSGQALTLLWLTDTPETPEAHANLRTMIRHSLEVTRSMYMASGEGMHNFVDEVLRDLKGEMSEGAVPVITKSTIGSILVSSDIEECHDCNTTRAQVFYWRVMVDYLADHSHNEADKFQALGRFIAPMKTMVDHMERILIAVKHEESNQFVEHDSKSIEERYIMEMSLVENTISVLRHCQPEPAGQQAYKQLLISMLMNPFYQKKIFDIVAQELVQFYVEDPKELFSLFHTKIEELQRKSRQDMAVLEGSVHIGEEKKKNDWKIERETKDITEREQINRHIKFYEVQVLNALMKTNLMESWSEDFHIKYTTSFRKQQRDTDNLDARIIGSECLLIVGVHNLDFVKDEVKNMLGNLKNEPEPLQMAIIAGITDIFIKNEEGMGRISRELGGEDFSQVLATLILTNKDTSDDSNAILSVVQAMARVLLNRKPDINCPKWESNLISMLFRASWATRDWMGAKIRSVIIVFLKFFCSLNYDNQLLLIKGYRRFFDMWETCATPELLTGNKSEMIPKLKRCAATFVALTRHSNLSRLQQTLHRPAHYVLVNKIISEIAAGSSIADYYSYALSSIDFNVFQLEEQNKIYLDVTECIDTFDEESGSRLSELRKASRKLARILGIDEEMEDGEDMPSQYSRASGSSSRAQLTRGKRSAVSRTVEGGRKRGRGRALEMDRIEEEGGEEEGDEGEEQEEMMDDPNIPSTSTARAKQIRVKNRLPKDIDTILNPPSNMSMSTPSARRQAKPEADPLDLLNSPTKTQRKPPSRPTTASRRAPTPNRSTPLRTSARRLNK